MKFEAGKKYKDHYENILTFISDKRDFINDYDGEFPYIFLGEDGNVGAKSGNDLSEYKEYKEPFENTIYGTIQYGENSSNYFDILDRLMGKNTSSFFLEDMKVGYSKKMYVKITIEEVEKPNGN
jgi:hypothetical protein